MDNKSFRLYSDEYVFLRKLDVLEDTLTQSINTLSELKLSYTGEDPQVGQFIVFKDALGEYHEMVIKEVNATHSVAFNKSLWAVDSFANTAGDYVDEKRVRGGSPHMALSKLLENTMWSVGSVSATNSADISFYHTDVFKGLLDLVDKYGIEYRTRIVMGDTGIRERFIDLAKTFGNNNGKRFTYGKDLISIEREYSPRMVYTAMHGYGKGIEKGDGYSRSITFESINGGKDYIADEDARLIYGRSDGHGGRVHNHGRVDFSDCEEPAELIKLTRDALKAQLHPDVTYRVHAVDLKRYGYDFEGVALGDEVLVIDKAFTPEIRVSSRVTEMTTSLTKPIEAEYQFGTFNNLLQKSMRDTAQAIDGIKANQPIWDRAGAFGQDGKLNASYLTDLFEHINGIFRAAGTYVKFSEERGILLFNAPDEAQATWAMQLASSGWRVASTKKANGEWNWSTAATGDGITANVINAGVLRGGQSSWNLDSGVIDLFSGNSSKQMRIHDGAIEGYNNGKKIGSIDYSAHLRRRDTGEMHDGLSIKSDVVAIYPDTFAVAKNQNDVAGIGFTGEIEITPLTSVGWSKSDIYVANLEYDWAHGDIINYDNITMKVPNFFSTKKMSLRFVNGICTSAGVI